MSRRVRPTSQRKKRIAGRARHIRTAPDHTNPFRLGGERNVLLFTGTVNQSVFQRSRCFVPIENPLPIFHAAVFAAQHIIELTLMRHPGRAPAPWISR